MPPVCLPSHFFYSLIRNLFLSAQNIVFSQVSATFVLPIPFFLFPNSQPFPNCKKHCVFTGKCCMCLSSHFFLFPNSQLIPTCAKHCVFTGRCACLSRPIFSYSLIQDLFVWRGPANGFCNLNSMRQLLIKNRKYFSLKKKQQVTNDIIHHAAHPSWYCLVLWCFHIFWSPNSVVETSMCMLLIFFQTAQNIGFSQVNASCVSPVPFFLFPNDIIHWQGHVKRISPELGNRKKWDERDMHIYLWKHNALRMLE